MQLRLILIRALLSQSNSQLRVVQLSEVSHKSRMGNQAGKERLSKADVEFLKTNTRYDEDTIQQWYKGFMKDCPEGKLSPPMFIKIYSKCFPTGNAEEFCAHVFRTFDSDKNGTIDFKEFLLAIDVSTLVSSEIHETYWILPIPR